LPGYPVGNPGWQFYANHERLDPAKRLSEYTAGEMRTLLHGSEGHVKIISRDGEKTQRLRFEELAKNITRRYLKRDVAALSEKSGWRSTEFRNGTSATVIWRLLSEKLLRG
jgi:excinuclease UvrABC ATPase subunit